MSTVSVYRNGKPACPEVFLETIIQVKTKQRIFEAMVITGVILPYTKGQHIVVDNITYVVTDVIDSLSPIFQYKKFERLVNVKIR